MALPEYEVVPAQTSIAHSPLLQGLALGLNLLAWIAEDLPESDRVRDVVDEYRLAIAVDVGRDEAKAVEMGAQISVGRREVHRDRLAVERDDDLAGAAIGAGVVVQCPVVGRAVGIDVRRRARAAVAAGALRFHVAVVGGI